MSDVVFNSVYFLSSIFSIFYIEKFMSIFLKEKKSKWFNRLAYLSYPVITCSAFWLINIPLINLLCNILCLCFITTSYKSTIKNRIIAVIFTYAFMIITELLILSLTGYTGFSILAEGTYSVILGNIVIRLILYFEAIIAQNLNSMKNKHEVSNLYWLSSFLIPLSSIYLIIVICTTKGVAQINVIISAIVIFCINILAFYLYDAITAAYNDKISSLMYKQEKEYYYNQCSLMQSTTQDLRKFRHDIKNHLIALNTYSEAGNLDGTRNYLEDLIGEIEKDNTFSSTGNIAFDSIINYKLRNAKDSGINVTAEIKIPKEMNFNTATIIIILGNLLDNAIEALSKTVDNKRLSLRAIYNKGRILISVENTYDGNISYEGDKILTTKTDSDTHGYGLQNVRDAVSKYDGELDISHTNSVFNANVILYLRQTCGAEIGK